MSFFQDEGMHGFGGNRNMMQRMPTTYDSERNLRPDERGGGPGPFRGGAGTEDRGVKRSFQDQSSGNSYGERMQTNMWVQGDNSLRRESGGFREDRGESSMHSDAPKVDMNNTFRGEQGDFRRSGNDLNQYNSFQERQGSFRDTSEVSVKNTNNSFTEQPQQHNFIGNLSDRNRAGNSFNKDAMGAKESFTGVNNDANLFRGNSGQGDGNNLFRDKESEFRGSYNGREVDNSFTGESERGMFKGGEREGAFKSVAQNYSGMDLNRNNNSFQDSGRPGNPETFWEGNSFKKGPGKVQDNYTVGTNNNSRGTNADNSFMDRPHNFRATQGALREENGGRQDSGHFRTVDNDGSFRAHDNRRDIQDFGEGARHFDGSHFDRPGLLKEKPETFKDGLGGFELSNTNASFKGNFQEGQRSLVERGREHSVRNTSPRRDMNNSFRGKFGGGGSTVSGNFGSRPGPGNFEGGLEPGNFEGRSGPGEFRGKPGPRNPEGRSEHGNFGERSGPGNFEREFRPETFESRSGPGKFRGKQGPRNFEERSGPGNFGGRSGPGNFEGETGPGTFVGRSEIGKFRGKPTRNPEGRSGPSNFADRSGAGNFDTGSVPVTFEGRSGPGKFRGKPGPRNSEGRMGPSNFGGRSGPGNFERGSAPATFEGRSGTGKFRGKPGSGNIGRGAGSGYMEEKSVPRKFEGDPGTQVFEGRSGPSHFEGRSGSGKFGGRSEPNHFERRSGSGNFEGRSGPDNFERSGPGNFEASSRTDNFERAAGPGRFEGRSGPVNVERSEPGNFEGRSGPDNFERRSRPVNFEERSGPDDFERRSRPGKFERKSRPGNFEERSGPDNFERSGPGNFEGRSGPDNLERSGPRMFEGRSGLDHFERKSGPDDFVRRSGPENFERRSGPDDFERMSGPKNFERPGNIAGRSGLLDNFGGGPGPGGFERGLVPDNFGGQGPISFAGGQGPGNFGGLVGNIGGGFEPGNFGGPGPANFGGGQCNFGGVPGPGNFGGLQGNFGGLQGNFGGPVGFGGPGNFGGGPPGNFGGGPVNLGGGSGPVNLGGGSGPVNFGGGPGPWNFGGGPRPANFGGPRPARFVAPSRFVKGVSRSGKLAARLGTRSLADRLGPRNGGTQKFGRNINQPLKGFKAKGGREFALDGRVDSKLTKRKSNILPKYLNGRMVKINMKTGFIIYEKDSMSLLNLDMDGSEIQIDFPNSFSSYKPTVEKLLDIAPSICQPRDLCVEYSSGKICKDRCSVLEKFKLDHDKSLEINHLPSKISHPSRKVAILAVPDLKRLIDEDKLKAATGASQVCLITRRENVKRVFFLTYETEDEATTAHQSKLKYEEIEIIMTNYKIFSNAVDNNAPFVPKKKATQAPAQAKKTVAAAKQKQIIAKGSKK